MFKQLFAALVLTTVMVNPGFAHDGDKKDRVIRKVEMNTPVNKIIIVGSAEVILTNDVVNEVAIEGKADFANAVKLVNKNGQLTIVSRLYYGGSNPVIRIPVKQLEALEIHGDGKVSAESILRSAQLNVFINGSCQLSLRSTGNIVVDAAEEYELKFIKNEKVNFVNTLNQ